MNHQSLLLPLGLLASAALALRAGPPSSSFAVEPASAAPSGAASADPPWLTGAWPPAATASVDDPHSALHADAHESSGCPAMGLSGDESLALSGSSGDVVDPHLQARHVASHVEAGEKVVVAPSRAKNGHTVARLFERREGLEQARVRVRGQVVLVNEGIMERNFVHLRDGTGREELGDHDLTVTTTEHFEVGETVEVEGVLVVDRDLGLGYSYAALLERAVRM